MVVYSSPVLSLDFDAVKKVLTQDWKGYATSAQFREGIDKTVDYVNSGAVAYIISNTSNQRPVGPEDSKYAASVMPKLFASGVKAMAFVLPHDVFTRFSLKKFADAGHSDQVGYFEHIEEARKWSLLFK